MSQLNTAAVIDSISSYFNNWGSEKFTELSREIVNLNCDFFFNKRSSFRVHMGTSHVDKVIVNVAPVRHNY